MTDLDARVIAPRASLIRQVAARGKTVEGHHTPERWRVCEAAGRNPSRWGIAVTRMYTAFSRTHHRAGE